MTLRRTMLCALWDPRQRTVWLFVVLIVLAGAERRIADVQHTFVNLATPRAGLASDEKIDGDEVALRLIALDDAERIPRPAPATPQAWAPSPRRSAAPTRHAWRVPPLRAPPASTIAPTA